MEKIIVTLDGPCASGKSTIARELARKLGFVHIDSGALYRAVGLAASRQGVSLDDGARVADVAKKQSFRFEVVEGGATQIVMNGVTVGAEIRTEEVGNFASKVAVHPQVRSLVTEVQRSAALDNSVVLEGRDAGTVVFPKAGFKFYLDASIDERAQRRLLELKQRFGDKSQASKEQVILELQERDHRDSSRAASPLKKADDAILIDTTGLTISEVLDVIAKRIESKN